jgi:hypothetical protein
MSGLPAATITRSGMPAASARFAEALRLLAEVATAAADPGEGPEVAERALRDAGLRPRAVDDPARPDRARPQPVDAERPAPLVARLAELVSRLGALGHAAAEPAHAALVEAGAQALTPPEELADYDLVLPLALIDRGAPTPARIAVARRSAGGGGLQATYVRVDAELSRLGAVSARLSALDGGPVTVHVVAARAAHPALDAVLPALEAALAARGQPTRVRLAAEDEDDG